MNIEGRRIMDIPPGHELTYTWKIENFHMCPQGIDECLKSSLFYLDAIDQSQYQLLLFPRGRSSDEKEVFICLLECQKNSEFPLKVTLIVSLDKTKVKSKTENLKMDAGESIEIPITLYEREQREKFPLPGRLLTVSCTLTHLYDSQTDERNLMLLSESLGRLLQCGYLSDISLETKGGLQLLAHKSMLATRCPELAKKMNFFDPPNTDESLMTSVTPGAVNGFLHFAYTGLVPGEMNEDELLEIYHLSVQFQMDSLKRVLLPFELVTEGCTPIKLCHQQAHVRVNHFPTQVGETKIAIINLNGIKFGAVLWFDKIGQKIVARLSLRCNSLETGRFLVVEYNIRVVFAHSEIVLGRGVHLFRPCDYETNLVLSGQVFNCYEVLPDSLMVSLAFLTPRYVGCERVLTMTDLEIPDQPIWKRAFHRLSLDMEILYKNDLGSDLRVRLDCGHVFPVHRWVLSARAERLASTVDENVGEIRMADVSLLTADAVLRFVYCGKLSNAIDFKDLMMVYKAATKYEVLALARRCMELIESKINFVNLSLVLRVSREFNDEALNSVLIAYIRRHKVFIVGTHLWDEIVEENHHLLMIPVSLPSS